MDAPRPDVDGLDALQALWDPVPTALYRADAQGRLTHVNRHWQRLHGLSAAEAEGEGWLRAVHPDDAALLRATWQAMLQQPQALDLRHRLQGPDAEPRVVHNRAALVRDAQGRVIGWAGVVDDVTEPLQRTQELHQEQALRLQLERHAHDLNTVLRERSEMLNVLAHEVRQPLNNASAALQNAARTLALSGDPQATEPLTRAQRVLGQVMAGVDNALAVASLVASNGQAMQAESDVDLLLGIAIADMPSPERERIRVVRDTATRTLMLDPNLTRLALRNLLANALAFSPANAAVEVRLSDAPNGLFIDVIDRGPGIDATVLPKLFQRGARGRAHERRGSHGLGLYIVRRALEMQGGRAFLLTTGPMGSSFRLELNEDGLTPVP